MVTQPNRLEKIRESIDCFHYQTYPHRELVVVHTGDVDFHRTLCEIGHKYPEDEISIFAEADSLCLGELRNRSIRNASLEFICQWDDDDLNHPARLAVQFATLEANQGDFCFFTDQLHYFRNRNFLFWDDWNLEPYPGNLIEGSIMGKRELIGEYPALARGEDTPLMRRIVASGHRVAQLAGHGYLMIYTYHGDNAWGFLHHASISRLKHKGREQLAEQRQVLRDALRNYSLGEQSFRFPCEDGILEIRL